MGDESDDVIVDTILASPTRIALFPHSFTTQKDITLSVHNLNMALSVFYGFTGSCGAFMRPLKLILLTDATVGIAKTRCIQYSWLVHDAISTPRGRNSSWMMPTELVGGVTHLGFLCGAFVVICYQHLF